MTLQEMTDGQLQAQYNRVRKEISQWTDIIQGQMFGEARAANEKARDRLWALACDLKHEINERNGDNDPVIKF